MTAPAPDDTLTDALEQIDLLGFLSSAQLRALSQRLSVEHFEAGSPVFAEGDPADRFYLVQHGTLRVLKSAEESAMAVSSLGPGDHFGEIALIDDTPRTAGVVARTDVVLLSLAREDFQAVLAETPELADTVRRLATDTAFRDFMRICTGFGRDLSSADLKLLLGELRTLRLDEDEVLTVVEPQLMILRDGRLLVIRPDGIDELVLATLTAGQTLGEDRLVNRFSGLSFRAATACTLYSLSDRALLPILTRPQGRSLGGYLQAQAERWKALGRD